MLALAFTYQHIARQLTALASLVLFVSVVLYGTFLLLAVGRAAALEGYQSDARDLEATLAQLESQYLAQEQELTPGSASQYGLVGITSQQVAYVAEGSALSMRR
jgi:hypothetical protein